MGEGKGPETEVGGGVGDAVEAEFCLSLAPTLTRTQTMELGEMG